MYYCFLSCTSCITESVSNVQKCFRLYLKMAGHECNALIGHFLKHKNFSASVSEEDTQNNKGDSLPKSSYSFHKRLIRKDTILFNVILI